MNCELGWPFYKIFITSRLPDPRHPSSARTTATKAHRRPTQAHEGPQHPTTTNEGQHRSTAAHGRPTQAHSAQRRPTQVNTGQHRPTKAHSTRRRPTQANAGPQKPTAPNDGQRTPTAAHGRPTQAHEGPQHPTTAHVGQRRLRKPTQASPPRPRQTFIGFFFPLHIAQLSLFTNLCYY